ncbi:RseA-like anti sigma(E) protein [Paucimonas lemoignei]|uniref:RseA-like anti sigma(E) protein n=1 Tax=Paucimonas lemoignei TaxID=29443 RepID=A0A4V2UI85_PAULE|nr:sigma-E factor negative regulatory protein [Paucimonas lemoignei]TCS34341.1 RseA-like anti sigma(E) protein [Paucimonas lemoignei]
METREKTQEQISALADDELSDSQIEVALAALRDPDARADWELYHQIGDILRSDDMAVTLSDGFSARMAARLEAEPVILAPQAAPNVAAASGHPALVERVRRLAMPGMAAAAVATAVFMTAPHMLVAKKESGSDNSPAVAMVAAKPAPAVVAVPAVVGVAATEEREVAVADQGEVLRDPRIDEYLMAHQRFSPSVYSSAQYARSATFANEAGK